MSISQDTISNGFMPCIIASISDFISISSVIKYLQQSDQINIQSAANQSTFFIDNEGCSMQDQIQYIQIQPPHLKNAYLLQILDLSQSNQAFEVEVDIFFQSSPACLDQCSINRYQDSQNTCDDGSYCQCSINYIGQRCQLHVNKFSDGESNIQVNLEGFSWSSYKLDIQKIQNQYTLNVNNLNLQAKYSIIESGLSNYQVPSLYQNINIIDKSGSYSLQQNIIQNYQAYAISNQNQKLSFVISFYNPNSQALMFSFDFSSQLNSGNSSDQQTKTRNIIVITICIVASVVSIPIIYHIVNKLYSSKQDIIIPSQPVPFSPYNIHLVEAQLQKKNGSLSKEIIEKFMPSICYANLVSRYQNLKEINECMICLTDFEESNLCRMTICYHLFHKNCLESWLELHDNCPFCRKELNQATLEDNKLQSQENPYINRIVQSSNFQNELQQDKIQEYHSFNDLEKRKNSQQYSENTNFTSQENSNFFTQSPSIISKYNKMDYNQADSVIQDKVEIQKQDQNCLNVKDCKKSNETVSSINQYEHCNLRKSRIKISFVNQVKGDEVGIQSDPQQQNEIFCEKSENLFQIKQKNRLFRFSVDDEEITKEEQSNKLNGDDCSYQAFSQKNSEFYIQQNTIWNEQNLIFKQSIESAQIIQQDHKNQLKMNFFFEIIVKEKSSIKFYKQSDYFCNQVQNQLTSDSSLTGREFQIDQPQNYFQDYLATKIETNYFKRSIRKSLRYILKQFAPQISSQHTCQHKKHLSTKIVNKSIIAFCRRILFSLID
ncbi:hypothetical protein ABPG74_015096 [Tetrahymena malaccensis]